MRRQLLVNGALVALALGTLGVVWATRDIPTTNELAARKNQLFPEFTKAHVNRVKLSRGADALEIVREGDEFRIVEPWPERADVASMNKWLAAADLAMAERPAPGISPAQAGFGPSAFRVELEVDQKRLTLTLGGPAPAPTGARYAQVESEGGSLSCVVRGSVASELDVPFESFRETRLLEYGRRELARIALDSPQGAIDLEQREHGAFFLQVGATWELANPGMIGRITEQLARLSSESFIEPTQARAALGDATVELRLVLKDKAVPPVSIKLGGACPTDARLSLLLREQAGRAPRAACVDAGVVSNLTIPNEDVRLRGPFAARTDEIEELRIVRGAHKLELARKDKAFVLRAPSAGEVPLNVGNQRISALLDAKGAPGPGDAVPSGEGEVTIQVSGGDEASHREERILLGKPRADGGLCFKRVADNVTRCVTEATAHDFEPDARLLRSLSLLSFAPSELSTFSVETPDFKQRVVRHADGSYELAEPKGFAHDGALVADVVQELGTLEAARWVATGDEPAFGLAQPALRVSIQLASKSEHRELVVGQKARGQHYARLSPDPAVFMLEGNLAATLAQPLIDRNLCPFAEAELSRIDASVGGEPRTLTGPLREALAALRASGVAHLGPPRATEGFDAPKLVLSFVSTGGKTARVTLSGCEPLQSPRCYARRGGVNATFTILGDIANNLRSLMQQ